jgi:hypothetical protein
VFEGHIERPLLMPRIMLDLGHFVKSISLLGEPVKSRTHRRLLLVE